MAQPCHQTLLPPHSLGESQAPGARGLRGSRRCGGPPPHPALRRQCGPFQAPRHFRGDIAHGQREPTRQRSAITTSSNGIDASVGVNTSKPGVRRQLVTNTPRVPTHMQPRIPAPSRKRSPAPLHPTTANSTPKPAAHLPSPCSPWNPTSALPV